MQDDICHSLLGQKLHLLPEGAVFWHERKILLLADLHLGKEGTFRSAGIPVPDGPSRDTVERLQTIVERTSAEHIVILGDFFHGENSFAAAGQCFEDWRRKFPSLRVDLVAGSHDKWSGELPARWSVTLHEKKLHLPPFTCKHYPEPERNQYVLAGHFHPGIVLSGSRRGGRIKLPCFLFSKDVGILPAFGVFTGLANVTIDHEDYCYVIGDGEVVQLPQSYKTAMKGK